MASETSPERGFASDNASGAHPVVVEAIAAVNRGHQPAYGNDPETARLEELARAEFGSDARIFPTLNGTGTNVVALRAIAAPHRAVISAETAHIAIDETAAPEAIAGLKLLGVPTPDGKVTPELAATRLADPAELPHVAWPAAISISQPTELGTVYRPEEIAALADFAAGNDLVLHMDGARIFNAAASLDTDLAGASTAHGVDVLSLGANKNGTVFGEAVLFARPDLAEGFGILHKGTLQLPAKARFVSAQLNALLANRLGVRIAGDKPGSRIACRAARGARRGRDRPAGRGQHRLLLPAARGGEGVRRRLRAEPTAALRVGRSRTDPPGRLLGFDRGRRRTGRRPRRRDARLIPTGPA